ncbi:MAG TPA: YdeI/OmpD-associated family protein [Solirubrobacteraceae bacterium]|nr:YdeI/OmpD-associated family protein [Solirubrobacteraceae bacterium]
MADDSPTLTVLDADAWRAWLQKHHEQSTEVWLVLAKKGTAEPTRLSYDEALEEALCHGWIDGQVRGLDQSVYRQRFTPRRARSSWSKRNVGIVKRLTSEGRMRPAGLAAVEQAKADGRWEAAYAGAATIELPSDLRDALATVPAAQAMFDELTSRNRYAILYRIEDAKRAETRARRIERFVDMLARGETVYPQKKGSDRAQNARGRSA